MSMKRSLILTKSKFKPKRSMKSLLKLTRKSPSKSKLQLRIKRRTNLLTIKNAARNLSSFNKLTL